MSIGGGSVQGADHTDAASHARAGLVTALACTAQFIVVLDVSVVNVALPSVQEALDVDPVDVQWVVNAYSLVLAGFLLLGGRLADLRGRKRIFVLGLALFSAASLAGGLAGSAEFLVAARAVQGLGAAVLAPATLTIITTTIPEGHRRARAVATWTAVGVAGGAAGNLLGGLLTDVLSWRWVLLVNVPIGVWAILAAARCLPPDDPAQRRGRLDAPGAAAATVGIAALTFGITRTHEHGWTAPPSVIALAVGLGAVVAFLGIEARFAGTPLIPLDLFRLRAISVGNLVMLLSGACLMPMWYFLTFYMQDVLRFDPLQTGFGFLPHTVVSMLAAARLAPWLMRFVPGRRLIAVGAVIAAAGFWWQSHSTADSTYLSGVLGPGIVLSLGSGLLTTPLTTTVMSGAPTADAGAASGLMNTAKQVGSALGLATLVAVAAAGTSRTPGLDHGAAFAVMSVLLLVAAAVALTLPSRPAESAVRRAER